MPTRVEIRVTPRASSDRLGLADDGGLRVWVTTAPTDGKANKAVIKLLAKRLGVAKSAVTLVRGDTSRDKVFDIDGLDHAAIRAAFGA